MRKKMLLIYNPYAGTSRIKEWLSDIIESFTMAGYDITIRPTLPNKDTSLIVKEYLSKTDYDKIVCSGGDGTLNSVLNGIMISGKDVELGYIPAGTTNDFAYNLGVSKNYKQAVKVVLKGEPFSCDIGSLNGKYFTYVSAFGIFTDASYETMQSTKNMLGRMAYILEGIKRIPNSLKPYTIDLIYHDKVISGDFLLGMITNSESVGGFKGITGNDVKLDDGYFEGIFIRKPKSLIELQELINCLLAGNLDSDLIVSLPIDNLLVRSEESVPWTIDGEFGGEFQEVKIEVKHHAFKIMRKI
ncbi:MAG: YegS/Rv2252/BmrU family lipid kinase [Clostridiales bacterium]|mgnify:CR=1 FL=1|nr:YegS/Rv2252/BmrU family lipid kinase [Clostridiales bacterium]